MSIKNFIEETKARNLTPQLFVEWENRDIEYVGPFFDKQVTTGQVETIFQRTFEKQVEEAKKQILERGGKAYLLQVRDEHNLSGQFEIISKKEVNL